MEMGIYNAVKEPMPLALLLGEPLDLDAVEVTHVPPPGPARQARAARLWFDRIRGNS
jgi:hypothetical protein